MKKLFQWVKDNPNRAMFLVPILLVAGISISHVVSWYDIANPINWAIYLSIAIEVGAMTALVAATNKIKGGVWFMFGLVTLIQMIGNIFFSFKEIDVNGDLFKSWVELTSPIFELFGTEPTDIIAHKRWLAILGGGLLPVISLTSLHFFVKYEEPEKPTTNVTQIDKDLEIVSLMDLETILEKEEEEKPKVKKGRKKKEVVELLIEEKVEITTEELPTIDSKIESEEVETEVQPHLNPQDFGLELESEIQKEEIPVIPTRPTKLTYTKPNMSIDRL